METAETAGNSSDPGTHQGSTDSKRHLGKNVISNLIFFVFNVVTSILMVRYQVQHLGVQCYGMVVLANQFIANTQVLSIIMVGTIGRFVTLHVYRNELDKARSYFTTQFIAILWFVVVMIPVTAGISYLTPHIFNIPHGQERNTQILFFLVYMSFLSSLFYNIFQVATFIKQRFDIRNILEVINQIFRYSTWIIMFTVLVPTLWHIGLGMLIGTIAGLIATLFVFFKLTPFLKPQLHGFDKSKFFEMSKMGGWMAVGQLGTVLYVTMDSLVINLMIGPAAVGYYGPVAMLVTYVRALSASMMSVVVPPAIACYAKQDWKGLMRVTARAVRLQSLGLAIAVGIVCGLSLPFLTWWLPQYKSVSLLACLLLAPLVLNSGIDPIFGITYAINKTAFQAVSTIACGVLKLALAIILLKHTSLGLYGIVIADCISVTLKNTVFTPIYAGRILRSSSWPIYKALGPSVLVFAATAFSAHTLSQAIDLASLPGLIVSGAGLALVFGILTYAIVLNREDRALVRKMIIRNKKVSEAISEP